MKVFVESRFVKQNKNGISRDSKSIVNNLKSDPNIDLQTFVAARTRFSQGLMGVKSILNGHPKYLDFGKAIIFIPQLQGYLPYSKGTGVIRIHDIFPVTNPEWFRKISVRIFKLTLAKAIENEHLFICNSVTTQNSLLSIYPAARTQLVYCNTETMESTKCGHCEYCRDIEQIARKPFLLTVGTIEPRKNYERLIQIWKKCPNPKGLQLIIVGRYGWKSRRTFRHLNQKNQNAKYLQDVCDGGVQELTRSCQAYISVSLGEGFNLPAMDAARNVKPLILSDIPIHRELYGESATYLDPQDIFCTNHEVLQKALNNLEPVDITLIPNVNFDHEVRNMIHNLSKVNNE